MAESLSSQLDDRLIRTVDPFLMDLLQSYIKFELKNKGNLTSWQKFYHFILNAYKIPQTKRPSVSQLSEILKNQGIEEHATLSVLYAHSIYILALEKGLPIYGNGVNP